MYAFRLSLIAVTYLWTTVANAQILVHGIPLYLDSNLEVRLKADDDRVVLSAKIRGNLRNIRATLNSLIPTLNKHFECRWGPIFGATFSDIRPDAGLLPTNRLTISANVHVKDCFTGAPLRLFGAQVGVPFGAIKISLPITAIANRFSIRLKSEHPQLSSTGLILVGQAMFADFDGWLKTNAAQRLNKQVAALETALNKALLNPALQRQLRIFQPRIESIMFQHHGFDLAVILHISRRASAPAVSKWLN